MKSKYSFPVCATGRHWGKNDGCELEKGHSGLTSTCKLGAQQPLPSIESKTNSVGMEWVGREGSEVKFIKQISKHFSYLTSNMAFFSCVQPLSSMLVANIKNILM